MAPSVLALHGFTGSGADFDLLRWRAPELDWTTPDLPGHGARPSGVRIDASPAPEDRFAIPSVAAEVRAQLSPLPRPRILLGYSMGGRIALQAAVDHPDALDGLVLIGASPGIADPVDRRARQELDTLRAARVQALGTAAFADEWSRTPLIASQADIDEPFRSAMRARRAAASSDGWARSLEATGAGRMRPLHDRLAAVRCPALLIAGETDSKFGAIAQEMAIQMMPAHVQIIEDAGHAAHLEQPEEFLRALRDWLNDRWGDR